MGIVYVIIKIFFLMLGPRSFRNTMTFVKKTYDLLSYKLTWKTPHSGRNQITSLTRIGEREEMILYFYGTSVFEETVYSDIHKR